jgi:hypothetical protein
LPEQPALRRFLDDPAQFEAELRPKIADAAVAQARQRARRGELARALAEIGRATAYVPSHAGANALLKKLSARRAILRVASFIVAGLVLATATWLAWHLPWRKPAVVSPAPPVTQPIATVVSRAAPAELNATASASSVEVKTRVPGNTPTIRPTPASVGKPKLTRRASPAATNAAQQPEMTPTVVSAAQPAPPPALTPPSAPPAKVERPGVVQLFATGAICYPSLDAEPASVFMPHYQDVAPGRHKIFCTRNQGGHKELVGEIDLPPGAKVERTVTQKDGALILARPQ